MPYQFASFLIPTGGNAFALLEDTYLKGGFRVVETEASLGGLHSSTLKNGMLALCQDTSNVYQYDSLLGEWALYPFEIGPAGPPGPPGPMGAPYDPATTILSLPYDISMFLQGGLLAAGSVLAMFVAPRVIVIPAGMPDGIAVARVPSEATTLTYTIRVNSVTVGALSFTTSLLNGTFTWNSTVTLQRGDVLDILSPSLTEPNIRDVTICLVGVAQAPHQEVGL